MKKQETTVLDMNDGTHSRFDENHYRNCQPCLDDHIDFMQEQADEARMDSIDSARDFMEDEE